MTMLKPRTWLKKRAFAVTAGILLAGVVLLGAGIWAYNLGSDSLNSKLDPLSPDAVATGFHDAYQRGDTVTMCALSTGDALARMQQPGWCDTAQGWTTTSPGKDRCTLPDGRKAYVYGNQPLVLGQRAWEIYLSDTGQGVWRVTGFGVIASRSICDIYR